MLMLLVFAFVSGIITILSPCILPILPVVLAGGLGAGKLRSLGIVASFVLSFTFFTLSLTAIVQAFGISPDLLRLVSVVLIILFGLILVIPSLHDRFGRLTSRLANLVQRKPPAQAGTSSDHRGWMSFWGGLPVGLSLGLVWTPCVGPIMASVVTLALTGSLDGGAVFITLAYALGTALSMLLIMLTGRSLLTRVPLLVRQAGKIQRVFGGLIILVGLAIGFGWERQFQAALLSVFPGYGTGLTALENTALVREALAERTKTGPAGPVAGEKSRSFKGANPPSDGRLDDYGPAPEIVTTGPLLNREAFGKATSSLFADVKPVLSMQELAGKVVLVDFWTYSCVNCVRTIPYLRKWYESYKDLGFIILGIHTPEFEFEKSENNVKQAIRDLRVTWPVLLDNEYRQWQAYANRYWPAHYFIDARGTVRYFSFGEGHYETTERVLRDLLAEAGRDVAGTESTPSSQVYAGTPEVYLGYGRAKDFVSPMVPVRDRLADYLPAPRPSNGEWTLQGQWLMAGEYILAGERGTLRLGFNAKKVFLVVEPLAPGGQIVVRLDAMSMTDGMADTADVSRGVLMPVESRLYELLDLAEPGPHVLELEVTGQLRLFAFTFG
jgi:cytochrome c biogenesis protein CcdA/thiol-disulfide isomerase/thioredoxin